MADSAAMKVIVFGATGMVGQGVLRECLLDPEVENVLAVGRRKTGQQNPKLGELVHTDFLDFSAVEGELAGYGACFFCLGVSSAGMGEAEYRRVTFDVTMAAARALAKRNPEMAFIYISGAGTGGGAMWARVKRETENALMALFKSAYMFRPGYIQPLHGVSSSTRWVRVAYALGAPLYPLWKALFPKSVMTTEQLGRAMLHVARHGAPQRVLESRDILALPM